MLWRSALFVAGSVVILTALPLGWLAERPPVGSAFMLRSRFADPATGEACAQVQYRWVDWHQISPFVPRAVVLAEDQRFLEHDGFDFRSIERAIQSREGDARVRGASSITQQLAKNLFLWPGRSWARKGVEAWYTGWMELAWSKRRILELYLNVVQFGPCVFGVEAAAGRYFDARALQLTREQAALLAAVLPNPARLRAWNPGPYVKQRTREILELLDTKRDAPWLRRL